MSGRLVPAFCAGRAVEVPVRPSPADHRRVTCPSCGVGKGKECRDIESGHTLYTGHASRKKSAEARFGPAA